ncbi:LysR family transcriptional regulator ArgP [Streptomyces sp. HPF1205]|uniref:LysR family transcriptional regulator ArgP n=1 Tax=Streptomyces sp. HPF1205 TaxID=2873262 RepID=UPI001CED304F|nr:LysR family transcriptional regulator ArgP [Streptomyces sp. HPF1205]
MIDLPLDQVRTLLAAVDEGTFEAAAEVLHVTPSAVSQRVKALEQRTGRVLLLRTKPVRLTESGEVVVRFGRQLTRLERDAAEELGIGERTGPATLPIAVNADSLATWFLPALAGLGEDLGVCFDLHRDDQDHTAHLLRQGRVMAAVTSSPEPVQGCSVRPLGRMRYRAMAAPGFVARHLADGSPSDLLPSAPVVVFDRKDDLQDRFLRELAPGRPPGRFRTYVPSSESFVEAVAAGLGWGMIPDAQAAAHRAAGTLTDLAPTRPVDVALYWQQWKLDSPALAAVAEAVARTAARALARPEGRGGSDRAAVRPPAPGRAAAR